MICRLINCCAFGRNSALFTSQRSGRKDGDSSKKLDAAPEEGLRVALACFLFKSETCCVRLNSLMFDSLRR
jgi:hypothetical protein